MAATAGPSRSLINIYQPLPQVELKNERIKFSSADPFVWRYVQTKLTNSRNLDAKALYENRIKSRSILLENPARDSKHKKEQLEKKARRTKERERAAIRTIKKKEAKLKGLWKLEEEQKKYQLFVPLHHLWLGYMSELLSLEPLPQTLAPNPTMPSTGAMHAKLVKADYHGSILTVKQARNPCLIGISGIVIHETENAFKIITMQNSVKLIPKQGCIFAFRIPLYDVRPLLQPPPGLEEDDSRPPPLQNTDLASIPQMEFELYGNQFRFRSADRASRKFKAKETIEL